MNYIEAHTLYLKRSKGFVLKLALFHFSFVLVFDILAIYFFGIMTTSIGMGSVFNVGVVYALGIIISVICSTFTDESEVARQEQETFPAQLLRSNTGQ